MPNYYAQIDSEGRVEGLSELSGEVESEFLIPIDEELYDNPNILFTRYVEGSFEGYLAEMKTDHAGIAANGSDTLTIQIIVSDWKNNVMKEYNELVLVEVNGVQRNVKTSGGIADITITSDEPGEFRVRTLGLDRNAELKVVVTNGN